MSRQDQEKLRKHTLIQVDTEKTDTLEAARALAVAQVEEDWKKRQQLEREEKLIKGREIVENFYGATLITIRRSLPTVDQLKAQAEDMILNQLEETVADLEAEVKAYESYEKDVKNKVKEVAVKVKKQHVFTSDTTLEYIEDWLIREPSPASYTFVPPWVNNLEENIVAVKAAIPFLKENLHIFQKTLKKKQAEKPKDAELAEMRERLTELQAKAGKVVAEFDKLVPMFVQMPDSKTLLNKAAALMKAHEQIQAEFSLLRGQLAKWEPCYLALPDFIHVPDSLQKHLARRR